MEKMKTNKWIVFSLSLVLFLVFAVIWILVILGKLNFSSCSNLIQAPHDCSNLELIIFKWFFGIVCLGLLISTIVIFFKKDKDLIGFVSFNG